MRLVMIELWNLHYGIERLQDAQYGKHQTDDTVGESEMVKLYR